MSALKLMTFPDTPSGRAERDRQVALQREAGWRVAGEKLTPGRRSPTAAFDQASGCLLYGWLWALLEFRLAPKGPAEINVTFERDDDGRAA